MIEATTLAYLAGMIDGDGYAAACADANQYACEVGT